MRDYFEGRQPSIHGMTYSLSMPKFRRRDGRDGTDDVGGGRQTVL